MKIISGGQTGADLAALIAARELSLPTGGFAPKGWFTENGPQEELLRSFGLTECEEPGYPARTRRNLVESDGTLLIGNFVTGGSRLTYEIALSLKKPLFLLAHIKQRRPGEDRIEEFRTWLQENQIGVLNVAGNRESENPGVGDFTRVFLLNALVDLRA